MIFETLTSRIYQILARRRAVPQVVVFDTAFHQSVPACAYRYAISAPQPISDS